MRAASGVFGETRSAHARRRSCSGCRGEPDEGEPLVLGKADGEARRRDTAATIRGYPPPEAFWTISIRDLPHSTTSATSLKGRRPFMNAQPDYLCRRHLCRRPTSSRMREHLAVFLSIRPTPWRPPVVLKGALAGLQEIRNATKGFEWHFVGRPRGRMSGLGEPPRSTLSRRYRTPMRS